MIVPSLHGCLSHGRTFEEAISLHIEGLQAAGEPVPGEEEPMVAVQVKVA